MKRRDFIKGVGAGVVATSLGPRALAAATAQATSQRPNVVYIFSDQHRRQAMAHTGMPTLHTPAFTRMSREGCEFTNCISNYPLCSPHRAILMTSRWPYQQGVLDNNIDLGPNEMTLGKAFKAAGYRTGYIGKWHLGGTRAEPFGFDHSLIWEKTGQHFDTSPVFPANADPYVPKGYNATGMTDQAIEYMTANRHEPFFLMVSLNPPHPRWDDAPKDKLALYPTPDTLPRRPNEEDALTWEDRQGYCAHTTALDAEVGRTFDAIAKLGLAENTILCYSSDHGEMLGAHGLMNKRWPHEESIGVPFLVSGSGIRPASKIEALFGTIDVMPTLLGMAGIEAPKSCLGRDYSPWLRGEIGPNPVYQPIMHVKKLEDKAAPPWRGVRTKQHTYARKNEGDTLVPWVLFANHDDPFQMTNLAQDAPQLRSELDSMLEEWLKSAADPSRITASGL